MGIRTNSHIKLIKQNNNPSVPIALEPTRVRAENQLLKLLQAADEQHGKVVKKYFSRVVPKRANINRQTVVVDTLKRALNGTVIPPIPHTMVGTSNGRIIIDSSGTWEFHYQNQPQTSIHGIWLKDTDYYHNGLLHFRIQKISPQLLKDMRERGVL